MTPQHFLLSLFRGIGQVMLQNNVLTGLVFLIGVFYASWLMGIGALIGTLAGTLTAWILRYKEEDIREGYYGFNGTLVGIALLFFFKPTVLLFVLLVLAVIFSTLVMNYMHERKLSPYTFPFVLTAWIFVFLINWLNLAAPTIQDTLNFTQINLLSGISLGFSQVMLQASIVTGILFFIAILINSRISVIYALIGSVVGFLTGWLLFPSLLNLTNIGIFGFNGVLCGIAFAEKKWNSFLLGVIAISLSVGIIYGFISFGLTALTAPFVFATWIILFVRNEFRRVWLHHY